MRVVTFAVLFILMAIYMISAVGGEVFIDENVRPSSLFISLLVGTVVTGLATMGLNVDVPD